jgi:hypothetical protein
MAGRPHQCCQIVAVLGLGVDTGIEQAAHDQRKTAGGRVDDRSFAGCVHMIRIGTAGEQEFDDALIAAKGSGGKWRDVAAPCQVGIGAAGKQRRRRAGAFGFGGRVKRGRAVQIARVDYGAFSKKTLDQRHMPAARRMSERHCARTIPRLQRRTGRGQAARQGTAILGCRGEQRGVELNRGNAGFREGVTPIEFTAIRFGGGRRTKH